MKYRPRQHQTVQQRHGDTDRMAGPDVFEQPAAGRTMQDYRVIPARVQCRDDKWLFIDSKTDMTDTGAVHNVIHRCRIVPGPIGVPPDPVLRFLLKFLHC